MINIQISHLQNLISKQKKKKKKLFNYLSSNILILIKNNNNNNIIRTFPFLYNKINYTIHNFVQLCTIYYNYV